MKILALLPFFIGFQLMGQGIITDSRDGQDYRTFQLGNQRWFQDNLRYQTPDSWCQQTGDTVACKMGEFYLPTELPTICPEGWRVPSWGDYKAAIWEINRIRKEDSVRFISNKRKYKNLLKNYQYVEGFTLINDSTFFDLAVTGWIEGEDWEPQDQTTVWIAKEEEKQPTPHIHIRPDGMLVHSHKHNVVDKPKNVRRFVVRCICEAAN